MDSRELITELGLKVGSELWKYVITNRNIKTGPAFPLAMRPHYEDHLQMNLYP